MYHIPVLLQQSIDGLNIKPNGIYVDVTFGGGGHARAILEKLENGHLYAFDQDKDALANAPDDPRFTLINQNFRYLKNFLRLHQVNQVDGILADLGVSSHQFDVAERGFSTRFDGPLDMRMTQFQTKSATTVVNEYAEEELQTIFREYGEIKNSKCVAKVIVAERELAPINTTTGLAEVVEKCFPPTKRNKFLAMVFQALRIEVNNEMEALKELLLQTGEIIKKGGRLVVISYHSLEDRPVKNYIRTGNIEGKLEKDFYGNPITIFKSVNTKPIVASEAETESNSRARSAKLRIAEKL
jgi:16S rRNA (cytosine1402-N4)-methyltransferase